MARIFCKHNQLHNDKETARHCPGHQARPVVQQPPAPQRTYPTQRQLDFIRSLGGDMRYAGQLTVKGASAYIDLLKQQRAKAPAPAAPAPPRRRDVTRVPLEMLAMVREGGYAVRPDDQTPWTFLRISRPKKGRLAGCTKVQTQHGPELVDRMYVWPDNTVTMMSQTIEDHLLLLVVNQNQAAIDYGREVKRCCKCRTSLTDERSRWYGIGPECETMWPWIVAEVDDQAGRSYFPGIKEYMLGLKA